MKINLPDKLYYSIGEVALAFGVNASLLRYWEKEFSILKRIRKEPAISRQRTLKT